MAEFKRKKESGLIFDIQRFSIHDGPGIRTLIFLKGCPLRCQWCSNPEGQLKEKQLLFSVSKCLACGGCLKVCPRKANELINGKIVNNRALCLVCEKCVVVCPSGARSISGSWMNVSQIMKIIDKDEIFFRHSDGGITLGGGEPTYQHKFARALLAECKRSSIHTAIETCGYAAWETFSALLEKTDLVIFDIKHIDDRKHRKYTGVSNKRILENLERLLETNKDTVFRITIVPGFNDSEIEKRNIVNYLKSKKGSTKIEYLHYHEYGRHKYELLKRRYPYTSS